MKHLLSKIKNRRLKKASMLLLAAVGLSTAAQAGEVVYVTTYLGATRTLCPPMCYTGGSVSLSGGAGSSSAPGAPARDRYTYAFSTTATWTVQPTLTGQVYKIDVAKPVFASTTANALVTASTTDGVLTSEAVDSPVFNSTRNGTSWHHLAYITNNPGVTQPLISFAISSGAVGPTSSANRLNIDAFRFTEIDPCTGVAGLVGVTGPLAAGQTTVTVTGVDAAASKVTVFADGTQIGERTSGIVAGDNVVTVSALGFGSQITATQTKSGCTSERPLTGPVVGSGANVAVKAFLSLGKVAGLTGPIGAHTTNSFPSTYTMKATAFNGGSQGAPQTGHDLNPGQCWETVSFVHVADANNPTPDTAMNPNNATTVTDFDAFAALDALVFAINPFAPDSGPYDIYVDRIMNGDVVIEDFESYTNGGVGLLRNPNAAGTPVPGIAYLSAPNSTVISTNNSFDGTKSARIRFQYANASTVRWARILMNATPGKHYPQIDTTKPITIRYLVLPVGETQDKLSFPVAPVAQTKGVGENMTLTVGPSGDAPYTYQWKYNGEDISLATTSSYTKNNLQVADSGTYSVLVTGATCSGTVSAQITVADAPPVLNYSVSGGNITFTWSGSATLQSKSILDNSAWVDGATVSGYSEPLNSSTTKYFRLKR